MGGRQKGVLHVLNKSHGTGLPFSFTFTFLLSLLYIFRCVWWLRGNIPDNCFPDFFENSDFENFPCIDSSRISFLVSWCLIEIDFIESLISYRRTWVFTNNSGKNGSLGFKGKLSPGSSSINAFSRIDVMKVEWNFSSSNSNVGGGEFSNFTENPSLVGGLVFHLFSWLHLISIVSSSLAPTETEN